MKRSVVVAEIAIVKASSKVCRSFAQAVDGGYIDSPSASR